MRRYPRTELTRFLLAVDSELSVAVEVVIIGGAAAALRYGASRPTLYVDTFSRIPKQLEAAVRRAREATGLDVPFSAAGVADAPYHFEDRLERLTIKGLKKLRLWVPERHDLVLMKLVRGYEHDLEVIEEMHRHEPMDLDTLLARYLEMDAAIGDPRRLELNFVAGIERLFGAKAAEQAVRRMTLRL